MKQVRWGIVGAGRIAHTFARDMALVDNAKLDAVAARAQSPAQQFQRQYGIAKAYGGYEDLYRDPDIDAIYIATPHTVHAAQCRDAMQAGKAVLCEKPLTVTPQECRDLIAEAQRSDVYLMEGMWTWFLPAVRTARQWVEDGRIGRLLHVKADFGYPLEYDPDRREYDNRLAGGCLLEMGIYPAAIADLFMAGQPASVEAISHMAPNGVEDDVVWLCRYDDDGVATLGTSFRARLRNSAFIIGDNGYIAIPDFFCARECSLYRLDERVDHFDDQRDTQGFSYQIEQTSADIMAGRRESATVPLAASLRFQEHLAAVKDRMTNALRP